MFDDPIVREVRQIRDALARKFDYDAEAIIRDLMARQHQMSEGRTVVRDAQEFDNQADVQRPEPKKGA